jgi:hypothetical protein
MQGPLEKRTIKAFALSFCLTPAPGGSDAKAASKHALEMKEKSNSWPARALAKVHLDR